MSVSQRSGESATLPLSLSDIQDPNNAANPKNVGDTTFVQNLNPHADYGPNNPRNPNSPNYGAFPANPVYNTYMPFVPLPTTPTVVTNPDALTLAEGKSATFVASATGTPKPTTQWQVSTDGGSTWTTIAGASTNKLIIDNIISTMNGYKYRAVFTNSTGTTNSNAVALTVGSGGGGSFTFDAIAKGGDNNADTSLTTGSISVTGTSDLIIGAFFTDNVYFNYNPPLSAYTAGTGFNSRSVPTPNTSQSFDWPIILVEDKLGLTSSTAATANSPQAASYISLGLSFKAGTVTFVQANGIALGGTGYNTTSSPPTIVAYNSSVTAGNLLVAIVGTYGNPTPSVSDTLNNTWTLAGNTDGSLTVAGGYGNNPKLYAYYAISKASGANSVTFGGGNYISAGFVVLEYSTT